MERNKHLGTMMVLGPACEACEEADCPVLCIHKICHAGFKPLGSRNNGEILALKWKEIGN